MRELAGRASELLRRSVLTLSVMPDRELRFLRGPKSALPEMVMSQSQRQAAFGLDAVLEAEKELLEIQQQRAQRYSPSREDIARYLDVYAWLTWLRGQNDGRRDVEIIISRAFKTPFWKLAHRFGRSDETIRRWHSGAVSRIALQFRHQIEEMD